MRPEEVEPMLATLAAMQKRLSGHLTMGEEKQFLDLANALRGIRNRMIVAQWETVQTAKRVAQ